MGLTILAFLAVPALIVSLRYAHARGRGTAAGRIIQLVDLFIALFALLQGLEFLIAFSGSGMLPLYIDRASLALLMGAQALLLLFALEFPVQAPPQLRVTASLAVTALIAFVAYRILFTYDFVADIARKGYDVVRITGGLFWSLTALQALLGLAASVGLALRAFGSESRINRQRAVVALAGVLLGSGLVWLFSGLLPTRSGVSTAYVLTPLAALLIGGMATYGFYLSRLFDWATIWRTLLYYILLIVAVGLPAGALVAFLIYLGRLSLLVPTIGTPLVFLLAYFEARRFIEHFLTRSLHRDDYREQLESSLSHVDMSAGRDAVLEELYSLLSETLDFSDFTVLVEDDRGVIRSVYAPTGARALIDRGSLLAGVLERAPASVLLKSEAVLDPTYREAQDELLALFEALRAEALILVREGRRIIGVFSFGARRTGADYTYYDYDTFRAIYGKLFVFAYYLKNVARESLLHTVDRELALSDQIIRFALEKVDKIDHPKADAAWAMRSTRRLGGDFVDFVRLSKDRWFFVMGDVSGKGLSASMNMLVLKSMVRTFIRVERDFVGLISRVNTFIKENLPRGSFFAGIFGYFDFAKDTFYYINCGVPTVLLYSPSFDTFIEVQGEGKVLGFVRDISSLIKPRKLVLPPGSALVAATDGVTDSENVRGERFGRERLRRAVRTRLDSGSRAIADGVIEDLLQFTDQKQEDDITLLVMKYTARSAQ